MTEEKENKIVLEREYVVPLRKRWRNTQKYRRVPKAIKALKQFIARHMKVEERDINKVLVDKLLNEEIWHRSIRKPPTRIKVKAKKYSDGIVRVELAEIPQVLKWKAEREKRKKEEALKIKEKKEEKPEEKKPEENKVEEKKKEAEEKEKATIEAGLKVAKEEAKHKKHEVVEKKGIKKPLKRVALKK